MKQSIQIKIFRECYGKHSHDYPQIMVPLEKNMRIFVENKEFDITPKELIFIPSEAEHETNFVGRMLVLDMGAEILEREKILLSSPVVVSMKGQILQLIELIRVELQENPNSDAVHYLYSFLYSKLMERYAPPSILYITDHYDLPITIEQLAAMENYNVTYYNDWFKQQTGVSPGIFLRQTRIEKAKELLEETEFGMTEIAVMVGYSSNSTFTRAFHGIVGLTPKQYRKQLK